MTIKNKNTVAPVELRPHREDDLKKKPIEIFLPDRQKQLLIDLNNHINLYNAEIEKAVQIILFGIFEKYPESSYDFRVDVGEGKIIITEKTEKAE